MIENENQLRNVIQILDDENILANSILIGSWCLLFYKYIFEDFEPLVRTTDIDFYVPNVKSVKEKNNLVESFKSINYDLAYDSLTHKASFISPDGFEIEFITKLNRDNLSCVKLGNTGLYIESLSYVEIFTGNYIEIDYFGVKVKVASPASYVLQKLLINDNRKEKKEKDIESVKHVLFYLGASQKYKDELNELYNSLPKKWKRKIMNTLVDNNIELPIKI